LKEREGNSGEEEIKCYILFMIYEVLRHFEILWEEVTFSLKTNL
jgi:hypothetical protein